MGPFHVIIEELRCFYPVHFAHILHDLSFQSFQQSIVLEPSDLSERIQENSTVHRLYQINLSHDPLPCKVHQRLIDNIQLYKRLHDDSQ